MSEGWICCLTVVGGFLAIGWLFRPKNAQAGTPSPKAPPSPKAQAPAFDWSQPIDPEATDYADPEDSELYESVENKLRPDDGPEPEPKQRKRIVKAALAKLSPGMTSERLDFGAWLAEAETEELEGKLRELDTLEKKQAAVEKARAAIAPLTLRAMDREDAIAAIDAALAKSQQEVMDGINRDTQRIVAQALRGFDRLKTTAAKRRRIETALKAISDDEHPDEQQAEHITRLRDELAKLDVLDKTKP